MKKWKIYRLTVTASEAGLRLDRYLADTISGLSRVQAKKIIDIGGVHLEGRRMRSCSRAVTENEQIEVYLDHLPLEPFRLTPDNIVYQDKYLIVLNKPAGVDTQPTHARYKGTVYEALQVLLQDRFSPQKKPELGMVQRLDRGTTGLMTFSIHPHSHKGLSKIFMDHRVDKRYLALVGGVPQPGLGEIRSLLARSRKENKVVSVPRGGKEAVTRYRVTERYGSTSLVELDLLTGRSHQIRAHMAELGCPLLGDLRYGGMTELNHAPIGRPLLHSARLAFFHPVTGESLEFEAGLPHDMATLRIQLMAE
ncbi:MAG: RluA family pseudouridine synthase [Desulfuromonadales bacterium]|jgi:23S rRNA pseudouridine1911/1915/1917 synthase|nr:RluA family pseudouridine synthase [Desulfuromonadales bacterium]